MFLLFVIGIFYKAQVEKKLKKKKRINKNSIVIKYCLNGCQSMGMKIKLNKKITKIIIASRERLETNKCGCRRSGRLI